MPETEKYSEALSFNASFHAFALGRGFRADGSGTEWRALPAALLEMPSGGVWELWIDGRLSPLEIGEGEALLVPAGLRHMLRCKAKGPMETRYVLGSYRWLANVDMLSMAGIPLKLPRSAGAKLAPLLDGMIELWTEGCRYAASAARFHALAFETLGVLLEQGTRKEELGMRKHSLERLSKALDAMNSKPEAKHSCRALAAKTGLSPSRFNAVFRELLGVAPKPYLQSLRLRKASALLLSGDLAVYEVAAACGFSSSCYFCRFFENSVGMSPSAFRKEFRRR